MAERSYLDWNATAPLRPQALAALKDALAAVGNPSSVHAEGRAARRLVERAREEVAALVGAQPGDVFFTSGGTEANMLALTPAIETADEKRPRGRLLASAIEHSSVRSGGCFPGGAIEEVRALIARGLDPSLPAMKAVGVREIANYLAARCTRDEALAKAQQATRQYAKRQLTWFRNQTPDWPRITTLDPEAQWAALQALM